jgi:hypothetical protein
VSLVAISSARCRLLTTLRVSTIFSCSFSDEEIAKAFNALDCEALDKAMADSSLSPDKAGTEEEEGKIGEEKDGPDESSTEPNPEPRKKTKKNKKKSKK